MEVLNIHKRIIEQPKIKVADLFETLATDNDKVWPSEQWPKMKFKEGVKEGSKGGHGPIRYTITKFIPKAYIQFEFTKPKGFNGYHQLEIKEFEMDKTEIKHTIKINTTGIGILTWALAVRWLHNALIEDAFDKVENQFSENHKRTAWSFWVKFLRKVSTY